MNYPHDWKLYQGTQSINCIAHVHTLYTVITYEIYACVKSHVFILFLI